MDWKKLADQAKAMIDKRGGPESVMEDADELANIAQGKGPISGKLKAAAQAIKEPGAHHDPAADQPVQPPSEPS